MPALKDRPPRPLARRCQPASGHESRHEFDSLLFRNFDRLCLGATLATFNHFPRHMVPDQDQADAKGYSWSGHTFCEEAQSVAIACGWLVGSPDKWPLAQLLPTDQTAFPAPPRPRLAVSVDRSPIRKLHHYRFRRALQLQCVPADPLPPAIKMMYLTMVFLVVRYHEGGGVV